MRFSQNGAQTGAKMLQILHENHTRENITYLYQDLDATHVHS